MSRFSLMKLPFDKKNLEPYISEETINFHYNKHHNTYVNNLNNLINTDDRLNVYKDLNLEEIVIKSKEINDKPVFNNSAKVYNHDFFLEFSRFVLCVSNIFGLLIINIVYRILN